MTPTGPSQPRDVDFQEVNAAQGVGPDRLTVDDLKDVRLGVTASLGKAILMVRDVLELKRGSIVQLDKLAGEMTDIQVNGLPLARGEVVVIGDTLHVRIGEIVGLTETPEEDG